MVTKSLLGKKGLIIGIANDRSIAWGCARALKDAGADLAITYLNEKAEPYVRPLAEQVEAPIIEPLDITNDSELENLFGKISETWQDLDFVIHAIAYAPLQDLHGRITDSSREGFMHAMDVSCHSLARVAKLAEPMMTSGGCILTTSYYGSEKVVPNYNMMGPVKSALESTVRYLAVELGDKKIRVNAISPGPIYTRAASGIKEFDQLHKDAYDRSAIKAPVSIDDVGTCAKFLVSDDAKSITGQVSYVDSGCSVVS